MDILTGSINTGNIKTQQGADPDADNILLFSAEGEFKDLSSNEEISKLLSQKTNFEDIDNKIKTLAELDDFIIYISDKDQSTNAKFADNLMAKSQALKIKGNAQLKSRREEIEEMASIIEWKDVNKFIFLLANTAEGFIAEGRKTAAQQLIGRLCIKWMFDDYKNILEDPYPIIGQEFESSTPKTLHLYNINGHLFTLSHILTKMGESMNKKVGSNSEKYVSIYITDADIGGNLLSKKLKSRKDDNKSLDMDESLWNEISDNLLSNIKIGIQLKVDQIFNEAFLS